MHDGAMRMVLKCVHPLLFVGIGLFVLPILALQLHIADIVPSDNLGPCGVPVFLPFVPGEFMTLLGAGLSAIRFFEIVAQNRKTGGKH